VLKETYSSGSYTESTIADGGLSWPTEIAVDGTATCTSPIISIAGAEGDLLFGQLYAERHPTGSPLGNTFGVAVDGSGNVYISDVSNTRC